MLKIRPVRYFGRYLPNSKLLLFTPLIAVSLFIGLIFGYQTTLVKTIVVEGKDKTPLVGLDALKRKNLLLLTQQEISDIVTEQNPSIKSVTMTKVYPDMVVISPRWYTQHAYIPTGSGFLIVAADGRVLQKTRDIPSGLVPVSYYQKLNYDVYQSGQIVDYTDIKAGLSALKSARDLGLEVLSVGIEGSNMIRLQLDDKTVLFSAQKSIQLQAYQLEQLVRQFALEGKDYETIDIRFEKPVVKFAK